MNRIMEFSYTLLPNEQLLRFQSCGCVSADRLIEAIRKIGSDRAYRPGMPVFADFREAHTTDWDYSEIQRLRDYLVRISRTWARARWAAIVKPGSLEAVGHTVIVITEALDAHITIRLFDDPQAALTWLRQ